MFSGNLFAGIAFDDVRTEYNADSTVAKHTAYCRGKIVGIAKYEYASGLQIRAYLDPDTVVYATSPAFVKGVVAWLTGRLRGLPQ